MKIEFQGIDGLTGQLHLAKKLEEMVVSDKSSQSYARISVLKVVTIDISGEHQKIIIVLCLEVYNVFINIIVSFVCRWKRSNRTLYIGVDIQVSSIGVTLDSLYTYC